jgi:hypothetical protein
MKRTVICVSHATGSGGSDLGRLVADKLGFRLVDEEIVTRAAETQNVSVDELADVERRKSLLSRILREVASVPPTDQPNCRHGLRRRTTTGQEFAAGADSPVDQRDCR